MVVLIGIMIGFFILIAGGTFLASKLKKGDSSKNEPDEIVVLPTDCCGAHDVCEADHLHLPNEEIVYFDDEELDRFKEKIPSQYKDEEIDEIREVLFTLQPMDIIPWMESIEKRHITIPKILQQEARQLLAEAF